jgi:alkanesulfonate monooxygenase SsuD/methylene tetrahydromethanopterin reductase-like flavin-dependent oxidoreductase (luciferase family)
MEFASPPARDLGTGWLAAVSPESFALAAELGLNVMAGPFKPWPLVEADLKRYRRLSPRGQTSFTLAVYCDADHDRARRRAEDGILWVYRKIMEVSAPLLKNRIAGYEHYRTLGWVAPLLDKVLSVATLEAMGLAAVGDPTHVARKLTSLRDAGLDRVSLMIGGGDLSRRETVACVELLAAEVFPCLSSAPVPTAKEATA